MTERAERREEMKLVMEYIKLGISFAVVLSVVFAGLQWSSANEAAKRANLVANLALYQRMTNEWRVTSRRSFSIRSCVPTSKR